VATVRWAADQLRRRILPEGSESEWVDPSGEVRLAEVHVDRGWRGRTVGQLEQATGVRVAFLTRLGKGMLPTSETVVQDGDLVHVVMNVGDAAAVTDLVTSPPES
jgi:trk system potassium uptake protein TrkA